MPEERRVRSSVPAFDGNDATTVHDALISYSRKDKEFARTLDKALETQPATDGRGGKTAARLGQRESHFGGGHENVIQLASVTKPSRFRIRGLN